MNSTDILKLFCGVSRSELRNSAEEAARALMGLHDADATTQEFAVTRLAGGSTVDAAIPPLVTRVMAACVQATDPNDLPADRLLEAGHMAIDSFRP